MRIKRSLCLLAATLILCGVGTAHEASPNQASAASAAQSAAPPQDAGSAQNAKPDVAPAAQSAAVPPASAPLEDAGSQQSASPAGEGSIAGTVTDISGAVVPGATVLVTNGSALTRGANTNAQGDYTVTGLPAGTYNVTVTSPGFQDFQATGFALTDGQQARLDATLQPTTGVTKVTVKGSKVAACDW